MASMISEVTARANWPATSSRWPRPSSAPQRRQRATVPAASGWRACTASQSSQTTRSRQRGGCRQAAVPPRRRRRRPATATATAAHRAAAPASRRHRHRPRGGRRHRPPSARAAAPSPPLPACTGVDQPPPSALYSATWFCSRGGAHLHRRQLRGEQRALRVEQVEVAGDAVAVAQVRQPEARPPRRRPAPAARAAARRAWRARPARRPPRGTRSGSPARTARRRCSRPTCATPRLARLRPRVEDRQHDLRREAPAVAAVGEQARQVGAGRRRRCR